MHRPGFIILELFSGSGRHGAVVQRTLRKDLVLQDVRGNAFAPKVDLLRLDIEKATGERGQRGQNPELLSNIMDWKPKHITELKNIYHNKKVT